MKRAQALKYISERFAAGVSKSEVFEELRSQISFRQDLLSYLAEVPDNAVRERYKKANLFLFLLILFMAFAKFAIGGFVFLNLTKESIPWIVFKGFGLYIFAPFVLVFFAVLVFKFRGSGYRLFAMLGISYLLLSLSDAGDISSWLIWQIPTFIAVFLAYYIGKNAFPYYGFWGSLKRESLEQELEHTDLRKSAK